MERPIGLSQLKYVASPVAKTAPVEITWDDLQQPLTNRQGRSQNQATSVENDVASSGREKKSLLNQLKHQLSQALDDLVFEPASANRVLVDDFLMSHEPVEQLPQQPPRTADTGVNPFSAVMESVAETAVYAGLPEQKVVNASHLEHSTKEISKTVVQNPWQFTPTQFTPASVPHSPFFGDYTFQNQAQSFQNRR